MQEPWGYNKHIDMVEVLPGHLAKAVRHARTRRCGIRISGRLSALFAPVPAAGLPATLDFSPLERYPELPQLMLDDFAVSAVCRTDVLYSLPQLAVLILEQPLDIDISRLAALKDLRCVYSPAVRNIGAAEKLERLHLWSY
ncbi:hypothetical protein ACLD9W_04355 [Neisseria sp. WLZKY-1]|jgi:hypothetical protein|uniref:hypothetical protein n=1 Tax=Neisseria sp. WLZKY-1 TaxID=3390377 RepID=UPI00397DADC0